MVAVPQANGTYSDDATVARAIALATEGWTGTRISAEIGVPAHTVRDWLRRNASVIAAQRQSIAVLTGDLLQERLEAIADGSSPAKTEQLAVIWGIAQDKIIAAQRFASPESNSTFYQLVQSQTIQVIAPPTPLHTDAPLTIDPPDPLAP